MQREHRKGNLRVKTPVGKRTGYGWLAYRLFQALPAHLDADFYVLPPYDAVRLYDDLQDGRIKICVCAVDGTEIPQSWVEAGAQFHGIVLMLDHNKFKDKWDKVIGEFYPAPRTLFVKENSSYSPPQKKILGTVYTPHYRKNLETIIAVAFELYKRKIDAQIEIVSDPSTAHLWRHYAPPNLTFRYNLKDKEMVEWYLSLWAFFSFSMGEGGALPAMEAASLGVPTILPYHTAFKFIPRSVTLQDFKEIPSQGDPNYAGMLHVINPQEFIRVVKENDTLPPPPPIEIEFENTQWISALDATI